MRPARPLGGDRTDSPSLRLVGGSVVSAIELLQEAETAEHRGRVELARDLYERALQRASGPADVAVAAAALLALARLAGAVGETGVALDILEAALASATARSADADCARAAALRARVLWESGDLAAAEGEAARAREWARRSGDTREAAASLRQLAALAVARGAVAEGTARYEESLAELREWGHVADLSATLVALGELYDDVRRWDAADESIREAVSVAAGLGQPAAMLDAELRHAELLVRRGDLEGARAACERATETTRRLRDPRSNAALARVAAMVARGGGDFTRAEARLDAAEAALRDHPDSVLAAELCAERAELFHRQDRHRETLVALNRAYRSLSQLRGTVHVADVARRT